MTEKLWGLIGQMCPECLHYFHLHGSADERMDECTCCDSTIVIAS